MNQSRHSTTRVLVALAFLFATGFHVPVFAGDEGEDAVQKLGREIAEQFVADYFGEHSAEYDLFVSSAKKDRSHHFTADGQVITFYDAEKSVMVSITLGRVMSLDFKGLNRKGSCTLDDKRALAPAHEHFVADIRRFLDAAAPEVDLAALTPNPHVSLCRGGGPVSSHTWREPPDETDVFYGFTRVEVKFDLFTKQIHGFTVQSSAWKDPINVDAEDCREIVASEIGGRPGTKISRLALIRVFPLEGPAYPAWVATVETDPVNKMGLIWGSMGFSVQVHALTGEVIEDLKEYKAQPSDPNR